MKKRIAMLLAVVMMAGTLAACGSQGQGSDQGSENSSVKEAGSDNSSDKEEITLAWADASNDATMQSIHTAIEDVLVPMYEEKYGVKINTVFADSQGDVGQQITDVENFVAQGADVISCRPVDTDGSAAAFDYATSAGVPIISTWWEVNTDNKAGTLIVVDNEYIGQLMAEWLINYAEENDTTLKVGVLAGKANAPDTNVRAIAFEEAIIEKYGDLSTGKVQEIVMDYGEQDTNTSLTIMEDWMQVYDDMNCVFATNDDSAYGAIQVLKQMQKIDDFVVIGVNGNTYLNLVGEGELDMTVIIDATAAVSAEMDAMCQIALGGEFPDTGDLLSEFITVCDSTNFEECWEKYGTDE